MAGEPSTAEPATRLPVAGRPSPVPCPRFLSAVAGCRLPIGNCRFRKRNPLPTMGAQNDTTSNDDVPIPVGEARAVVQAETPSPILDVPSLGTAIEKAIREGDTARALELVTHLRNLR